MNTYKKTVRMICNTMQNTRPISLIILCLMCLNITIVAHAKDWKTETLDDGTITVQSKISKRTDDNDEKVQLIEYIVTTTTDDVSLQSYLALLKDVSKHHVFQDDKESKIVKTISEYEWIVYYYTDAPWPFSDSDCVAHMTFAEDPMEKTAVFTFTAAPDMFEKQKVKRMTYYNMTYVFKDVGNGRVEITITAQMSPTERVPGWMISAAFPDAAADVVRKVVKLAKEN